VKVYRRNRVRWKPRATGIGRKEDNDDRIVQEFIYTGPWPTSYRVVTLFGTSLVAYRVDADRDRPGLPSRYGFGDVGRACVLLDRVINYYAMVSDRLEFRAANMVPEVFERWVEANRELRRRFDQPDFSSQLVQAVAAVGNNTGAVDFLLRDGRRLLVEGATQRRIRPRRGPVLSRDVRLYRRVSRPRIPPIRSTGRRAHVPVISEARDAALLRRSSVRQTIVGLDIVEYNRSR